MVAFGLEFAGKIDVGAGVCYHQGINWNGTRGDKMKEIKAVIVDLDQTLLRTDKTISPYTLSMMQRCHERGITVMAATARPERSILTYHEQVRFDAMTTMNGARIILPDQVLENAISHSSGRYILSKLISIPDVVISVETRDGSYSNVELPEWNSPRYDGFPDLPTQGALYKILASSENRALYDQIGGALTDEVYHTVANGELVQVMSKQATKWNGIKAMLGAFRIPQAETVYFGDDYDDIGPIRMCGMGVAVSNAIEAVRNAADHITGSNDEDGVAEFIERNIL